MIGWFFHSFCKSGRIKYQGRVVSRPSPGLYLVQLVDCTKHGPSRRRLVKSEKMSKWKLYPDVELMAENARRLSKEWGENS